MTLQRRILVLLGLLTLLFGSLTAAFYGGMTWAARQEAERRGLPSEARNSIQHAFAAMEIYALFRRIGLSRHRSAHGTIWLGYLNERAEATFKWRRDSTAEVYKDLHNNLLGMIGGRVAEACRGSLGSINSRIAAVGEMAARRQLAWRQTDPRVPQFSGPADFGLAVARHEADQTAISDAFVASMSAADCPNVSFESRVPIK